MDKKILLQNLADSLADRTGLTKRKAEAFVRSFFEITEESLGTDGVAKVKGFGTTKIVQVSDRESVDINTGERIQIEGHAKVSFTPDTLFRDLVNRPFAHFTTIVLEDEIDESEIISAPETGVEEENESVSVPETETEEESAEAEITDSVETEETTETGETTATEETTVLLPVSGIAGPIEDSVEDEGPIPSLEEIETLEQQDHQTTNEEPQATTQEQAADEKQEAEEDDVTEDEEHNVTENEVGNVSENEVRNVSENEVGNASENEVGNVSENEVRNVSEDEEDDEVDEEDQVPQALCATGSNNPKSPIIINNTLPEPRHNWWKTAFVVLFMLLLALASYFAGYFRIFCPCNIFGSDAETITATEAERIAESNAKVKDDSIAKAKTDSVAKAKTDSANAATQQAAQQLAAQQAAAQATAERLAAQQAAAEKATQRQAELQAAQRYDQIPGSNYLITGVMQTRRIKPGENLYMIARQMYGHKDFARYISFFNNIEDPNHVTIGQTIRLPQLTRR